MPGQTIILITVTYQLYVLLCTLNRYMRMNNTDVDVANEHVFKLRKMVSRYVDS